MLYFLTYILIAAVEINLTCAIQTRVISYKLKRCVNIVINIVIIFFKILFLSKKKQFCKKINFWLFSWRIVSSEIGDMFIHRQLVWTVIVK